MYIKNSDKQGLCILKIKFNASHRENNPTGYHLILWLYSRLHKTQEIKDQRQTIGYVDQDGMV